MTATKLTLEEKQQRLEAIAGYSLEVLRTASLSELKDFAKGLLKGYSKLNREQLLGELIRMTEDVRSAQELAQETKRVQEQREAEEALLKAREEALKLEAAALQEPTAEQLSEVYKLIEETPSDLQRYGQGLYEKIKQIVTQTLMTQQSESLKSQQISLGIGSLATEVSSSEVRKYPKVTTRKSRRTAYLAAIGAASRVDTDITFKSATLAAIESFRTMLYGAWKSETAEYDQSYRQKVQESQQERIQLDPTALVQEALDILMSPQKHRWTYLVKALAIATGRRPAEIMVTARFEKAGDYEVSFLGQTKGRRDFATGAAAEKQSVAMTIPTLVKADLVISGMAALEATQKRLEPGDDPVEACQRFDSKYSCMLSRIMAGTGYKFKDLRKVYAVTAKGLFAGDAWSHGNFYKTILGHDRSDTYEAYDRYYMTQETITSTKAIVGLV